MNEGLRLAKPEAELDTFRAEVKTWLADNCPESIRTPMPENETVWGGRSEQFVNPDAKIWLEKMAERGWTCPTWPKAYGGGGLSAKENKVLAEELRAINARSALQSFGIWMFGPALLEFASEEQKPRHRDAMSGGSAQLPSGYAMSHRVGLTRPRSCRG